MPRAPSLLLTGGTGFVGRYLAPALRARFADHRCVLLCRENETAAFEGWECENAEIANEPDVDRIVAKHKPEIVVHLAAQSSVGAALNAAEETWRVNFAGSLALASALARHTTRGTFLFASTAEVYGRSLRNGPANEDTLPDPANSYAASKLAAERMLADVLPPDVRLIATRAFNHSGPGQDERFVLASFAAQIARIEAELAPPRMMVGNLDSARDFLHVVDVVDAYVRLIGAAEQFDRRTVVNIASGRAWKISDLLATMRGMARKSFDVVPDPARMRPSEVPVAVANAAKLKQLTGWEPRHPIPDMLAEMLDFARAGTGRA